VNGLTFKVVDTPGLGQRSFLNNYPNVSCHVYALFKDATARTNLTDSLTELVLQELVDDYRTNNKRMIYVVTKCNVAEYMAKQSNQSFSEDTFKREFISEMRAQVPNFTVDRSVHFHFCYGDGRNIEQLEEWLDSTGNSNPNKKALNMNIIRNNPLDFANRVVSQVSPELQDKAKEKLEEELGSCC